MSWRATSFSHSITGGSLTTLTLISVRASCPGTPSVATASKVSVPTWFAALKAKVPRAASATLTFAFTPVGCAPVDQVSGSPSSSLPVTCTNVVMFLDAVTVWGAITGVVEPCRTPATRTFWSPGGFCVSVNATTVAGSGLSAGTSAVATPRPRPSAGQAGEGARRRGAAACTTTGCAQASVVAPASGGPAEAVVACTTPVPDGSQR